MKYEAIAALAVVAGMISSQAVAIQGPVTLSNLVAQSEWIVVAHVQRVTHRPSISETGKLRMDEVAVLLIEDTWKGPKTNRLAVSVSPTWTCDLSTAKPGEQALFFLGHDRRTGTLRISDSGKGRMPIWQHEQKTLAEFVTLVRMPVELDILAGPDPRDDLVKSVDLAMLKKAILKLYANRSAAAGPSVGRSL